MNGKRLTYSGVLSLFPQSTRANHSFLVLSIHIVSQTFFSWCGDSEHGVNSNVDICGNDICEPIVGESCSSCPEDCKIPADCNVLGLGM